jgi:hypothetical protein
MTILSTTSSRVDSLRLPVNPRGSDKRGIFFPHTPQTIHLSRSAASELISEVINTFKGFGSTYPGPFPQAEFIAEALRKLGFK